jgi:hypothetical protein
MKPRANSLLVPDPGELAMKRLVRVMVLISVVALEVSVAHPASAAPSNDTEAGAIRFSSLPFTDSMDSSGATADGPMCRRQASVFYSFTPQSSARVQVDTIGSEFQSTLAIYTRNQAGEAKKVDCNRFRFANAAGVRFRAQAGTTYFVMVGACCGSTATGGPLVVTADVVADVDLAFTVNATSGSVDPSTGLATLTGTVTCNERSWFYREATLRQVRQGLYVARAYFWVSGDCVPGQTNEWSIELDTDTGVIFGTGTARVRTYYEQAGDGWREYVYTNGLPTDETVNLA